MYIISNIYIYIINKSAQAGRGLVPAPITRGSERRHVARRGVSSEAGDLLTGDLLVATSKSATLQSPVSSEQVSGEQSHESVICTRERPMRRA